MKKIILAIIILAIFAGCNNNGESNQNSYDNNDNNNLNDAVVYPETIVKDFLTYLGNQNFEEAYALTDNPTWGSFADFSSKKAFGGIIGVDIIELKEEASDDNEANFYAEVYYKDAVNGNNTFKQNFYLKPYGNKWKIVDMKLASKKSNSNTNKTKVVKPQVGIYSYETNTSSGSVEITEYDKDYEEFYYEIYVSTEAGCTGEFEEGIAAFINDVWIEDESDDCSLKFIFSKNSVKIIESECSYYHGVQCNFAGTYYKE